MTPHEFASLVAALNEWRDAGCADGAALATLVRTRGSAFRRAGACMLVHGDGRVVRGLSAGCPDADIAAHARDVIASGTAHLVRYDREHGYDLLLELGCGGELEVLVEPLRSATDLAFVDAIGRCLRERRTVHLMSVFARDGECLPQPRRLVWCGGVEHDGLGDPQLTALLLARVEAVSHDAGARLQAIETGVGTFDAFVERVLPPLRLVLVGPGLISSALARLAQALGWDVVLVDHREAPNEAPPAGVERVWAEPRHFAERVAIDARTAVVVVTHNLERDVEYLHALPAGAGYVGALGSRGRADKLRRALGARATGLHSPAGLDIGSETPEEIALAIASEIQAVTSGHGGGSLNASQGPIH
ncbi:MAG TPA: XdhC family protein [Nevskiaceae bacterium]|nr:XdhC family protein [Nevskiaceae bacterium]